MVLGIYIITNLVSQRRYVGSSNNIKRRWYVHKYLLRKGIHGNYKLQREWNQFGENSFVFEVYALEEDKSRRLDLEEKLIEAWNTVESGLNIARKATAFFTGMSHTPEVKQKIAAIQRGRVKSEEELQKISESSRGRKHSSESREKISHSLRNPEVANRISRKGKKCSEESRRRIQEGLHKRYENPEENQKLSQAQRKRYENNPQDRARVTNHFRGVSLGEEHKEKISSALKGKPKGKVWVVKEETSLLIPENELNTYLDSGWVKGRRLSEETKRKISEARVKVLKPIEQSARAL